MEKYLLCFFFVACFTRQSHAQYVYTINADSVKITNHCDTAELILENHTQTVPGFLFNKGRGRTEFRRALIQADDTTFLLGGDTLRTNAFSLWRRNGAHIYNINTGNVGIHRTNPNAMLDLPGPISIDDTSAYTINYHPVLRLNNWVTYCGFLDPPCPYPPSAGYYSNLFVGDSAGSTVSGFWNTMIGNYAGINSGIPALIGIQNSDSYIGFQAGMDAQGSHNTFVGSLAGQNNSGDMLGNNAFCGGCADNNSFFGSMAGQNSSGGLATFIGSGSGTNNNGQANTLLGGQAGTYNQGDWNSFIGVYTGYMNSGNQNNFWGSYSGNSTTGNGNIFVGNFTGNGNVGDGNILIGLNAGTNNQGNNNVVIGNAAGDETLGGANTFIGAASGSNRAGVSGNGITLIGNGSNTTTTSGTLSNATALGNNAVVGTSNTMVFGDTATYTWLFNSNATAGSSKALVVGSNASNGNGAYLTTGGVWTNASDRNKKEHFEAVNKDELLEKIASLPITRWNYKGLNEQHIGPVAQDFYQAFKVGTDNKTISTIDPSGIALAGIQGLYLRWKEAEQRTGEQQSKINELEGQLRQQQSQIAEQQAQMAQLLEKLNGLEAAVSNKAKSSN